MIGLVAYVRRRRRSRLQTLDAPAAIAVRARARAACLGMINGVHRHHPPGPGDRRDARHAAASSAASTTSSPAATRSRWPACRPASPTAARDDILGHPGLRPRRRRGRRDRVASSFARRGSVARSTPSAATPRPPPSSASRRGWSCSPHSRLCGLLAGVAGVMWVMEFGTINGTAGDRRRARGRRRGRRRRREHLRRVGDARRRRARRPVPRLHRERADPGAACRSSGSRPSTAWSSSSRSAPTRSSCAASSAPRRERGVR